MRLERGAREPDEPLKLQEEPTYDLSHGNSRFVRGYTDIPTSYSIPRSIALQLLGYSLREQRENVRRTDRIPLAPLTFQLSIAFYALLEENGRKLSVYILDARVFGN